MRFQVLIGLLLLACLIVPGSATIYTKTLDYGGYYYNYYATGDWWPILHDDHEGGNAGTYACSYVKTYSSGGEWLAIYRSYLNFNTSAIPDDASVTDAVLRFYTYSTGSADQFVEDGDWCLVAFNDPDPTVWDPTDGWYFGNESLIRARVDDYSAAGWHYLPIPDDMINITGYTNMAFKSGFDVDDDPPTWAATKASGISFYTVTYVPELIITYTNTSPTPTPTPTPIPYWTPTINNTYDWINYTNISPIDPGISSWNFEVTLDREDLLNMTNSSLIPTDTLESVWDMWDEIIDPYLGALEALLAIVNYPLTMLTTTFSNLELAFDSAETYLISYIDFWVLIFGAIFDAVPDEIELIICGGLVLTAGKILLSG